MTPTYCFVAAKSAGHILPALALAKDIKKQDTQARILFISTNTTLDQKLLRDNKDITEHISYTLDNIPYRKPWRIPLFFGQLIYSFVSLFVLLRKERPQCIISTGGLIAVPVCIAGWILGIAIDVYELNAEPGGAIKFLAPFAKNIYYCFYEAAHALPKAKRKKAAYPLYNHLDASPATYEQLNLDPAKKTLFVLGGSQGSQTLNHAVKQALLCDKDLGSILNIIHQIGNPDQLEAWRSWYKEHTIPAYIFSYEPTCVPYYKLADVVICRSGAGTLSELEALQKQYITIPLETKSTHHQVENAMAMERKYPQVVKVLRQNALQNECLLAQEIKKLL